MHRPIERLPPVLRVAPGGASASGDKAGRVVHLVGRLTTAVFSLLQPVTEALRRSGHAQVVVFIEDPVDPGLAKRFHAHIELVVLPPGRNASGRWKAWLQATQHVMSEAPAQTVHLHGFMPAALAAPLMKKHHKARLLFSPHDSRVQAADKLRYRMVGLLARPWLRRLAQGAVINMPVEARVVHGMPVALLDAPIDAAYFGCARHPARHPLVAGGVFDAPSAMAARFAQVAVLMGNGQQGLAFNWIGAVPQAARDQLDAASVAVFDERDAAGRAARLSSAWLYLCPHEVRGFPAHLAAAMACGLPAVVLDTPRHRSLVVDGVTGFLCATDRDLVGRAAELIHDAALRARMGFAARAAAEQRFAGDGFDDAVLAAYRSARPPSLP